MIKATPFQVIAMVQYLDKLFLSDETMSINDAVNIIALKNNLDNLISDIQIEVDSIVYKYAERDENDKIVQDETGQKIIDSKNKEVFEQELNTFYKKSFITINMNPIDICTKVTLKEAQNILCFFKTK